MFRTDPRSLFDLVVLKTEGEYVFESITVKTTEKRFDGFFKRKDGNGANIFSEFQGYEDNKIYWRFFREVFTWYEQTGSEEPFVAIILFVDKKYDPGNRILNTRNSLKIKYNFYLNYWNTLFFSVFRNYP